MSTLLPLGVAVPLVAAAAATLLPARPGPRRILMFGGAAFVLGLGTALVATAWHGHIPAVRIGGWPLPLAITFAGDMFSALMLVVAALMVLVCGAFAVARGEDQRPFFHPLVLVLVAGLAGAFLTADLFNLFVFFEVMLIASYVLLVLGGSREQLRAGAVYVTTNLLASTLLVAGVALVYGAVGTVNMAALAEAGTAATGALAVPGVLLLVAFAVKGSLVPVHGWLPRSYPAASPAVAALFSGLLTKVGIYAMYRVYAVVLGGDPAVRTSLLVVASVTMLVGVLGAVGRNGMREVLSFHIVSQVGYMVMGLGLFGIAGLAAGIFYILHHIVVKTSLFLSAGAVETLEGTGQMRGLGGLARRRPVLAVSFVVAALSLAGLPPLSGFFAKLALVRAALAQADAGVAAVAIGVSLLTLLSMLKIWNGVFWGPQPAAVAGAQPEAPPPELGGTVGARRARGVVAPAAVLAGLSLLIGLGAQGLFALADRAGAGLAGPAGYVRAVLGS